MVAVNAGVGSVRQKKKKKSIKSWASRHRVYALLNKQYGRRGRRRAAHQLPVTSRGMGRRASRNGSERASIICTPPLHGGAWHERRTSGRRAGGGGEMAAAKLLCCGSAGRLAKDWQAEKNIVCAQRNRAHLSWRENILAQQYAFENGVISSSSSYHNASSKYYFET
jgi:hypothetical protein